MTRFVPLSLAAALMAALPSLPAQAETALFAGGCFWCVESDLEAVPGVRDVVSGYAGGSTQNPTYKTYGKGGHREVVKVDFDETRISYEQLTDIFLRTIDVTDGGGQFCDRGHSYSAAIHALTPDQKRIAEKAVAKGEKQLKRTFAVPVEGAVRFWPAEDYHQGYYKSDKRTLTRFGYVKRATAYEGYREACGRDKGVKKVWGAQAYKGVPKGAHGS